MKLTQFARSLAVLGAFSAIAACACSTPPPAFTTCRTRADCPGGLACVGGVCGGDEQDAGPDSSSVDTGPGDSAPVDSGPGDAGSDPPGACASGAAQCRTIETAGSNSVDLLLMVDNSNSMTEEQVSLVAELPRIIRILSSGDRDGDGVQDFQPAESLHVGVVSSDMGLGAVSGISGCDPGFGDDGIMTTRGSMRPGCAVSYPSGIFDFLAGRDDASTFANSVGCVATLGTDGCGFEHQLESALKSISLVPAADGSSPVAWTRAGYRPPVFLAGTFGHGGVGGANEGFLRPDSVLAMLVVTDEDDCSAADPSIFDRADPRFSSVDLNLRCHTFPDGLFPVARYVDGIVGLRSRPELLVFAAITGVPPTAIDSGLDYDAILALPEMIETIDPVLFNRLLPSCVAPAMRGAAYPARRIVQVAQGLERLGAATSVQSICNTSFAGPVDAIITQLTRSLLRACLPAPLAPSGSGIVRCDLYETLPAIGSGAEFQHCADLPSSAAYELATVRVDVSAGVETRREVCRVHQAGPAGSSPGWFYDDGAASMLPPGCGQRISLRGISAVVGSETVLVCPR